MENFSSDIDISQIEKIQKWYMEPKEALNLTSYQCEFLSKYEIDISTAYIGMVRFYRKNKTIYQTNVMNGVHRAITGECRFSEDFDNLRKQAQRYLDLLISSSSELREELLNRHVPLFNSGELEELEKTLSYQK